MKGDYDKEREKEVFMIKTIEKYEAYMFQLAQKDHFLSIFSYKLKTSYENILNCYLKCLEIIRRPLKIFLMSDLIGKQKLDPFKTISNWTEETENIFNLEKYFYSGDYLKEHPIALQVIYREYMNNT